jgi:hypothetical protein
MRDTLIVTAKNKQRDKESKNIKGDTKRKRTEREI